MKFSLWLYRKLASAFPYEFKNAYGDELLQVTEEAIEPIWRRHGVPGLLRLLVDLAVRIPVEYAAEFRQDVRYGLRSLAASPGFTMVALVSLGLGIGVATSAFSDMNGFVLRDVPAISKPDELITIESATSYPVYERYRERSDLFSATLAYVAPVPFSVSIDRRTERMWGHLVTPSYFATLGVRPSLGRFFDEQLDGRGQASAVVVSYRFWRNRLGGDPRVVGAPLRMNGELCTVVGVGPRDFLGASPMLYVADLWIPIWANERLAPELAGNALGLVDRRLLQVVGRRQPGVTIARAAAELEGVERRAELALGDKDAVRERRRLVLLPGGKLIPLPKQSLPVLTGFFVVLGGLILLIASSNVANMLLARAGDRRKEIAIRLGVGAGRTRLVRQLLTESLLVASGASVLGWLLTVWLMRMASQIKIPYPMPIEYNVEPDGRVLVFAVVLTVFTAMAFGLMPAMQATRVDLAAALKEGGGVKLRSFGRLSARNLLITAQVAGSVMLLVIMAMLVLGQHRVVGIEVGFNPRHLYLLSMDPMRDGNMAERTRAVFERLLERLRGLPSVMAAGVTQTIPIALSGSGSVSFSTGEDGSREVRSAHRFVVGKDYFATSGLPIVRGRAFQKEDEAEGATAVIVSEGLGDLRRIEIGDGETGPFKFGSSFDDRTARLGPGRHVFEVVGVAKNEKENLVRSKTEARPVIYFPLHPADYGRATVQGFTLMVRGTPGADVLTAVRREVEAMDPNLTTFDARSMTEQIDSVAYPSRVAMWTYSVMGVFGAILAAVGLAGVTAYSVSQRRREIGIRMALGAKAGDVLGLVMKEGAALVGVGTIVGLAGAWAGIRALSGMLSAAARSSTAAASDPVLMVGAPALLAAVAMIACYLPARKSLRIDPASTLRAE